jgi:hypothetical protein
VAADRRGRRFPSVDPDALSRSLCVGRAFSAESRRRGIEVCGSGVHC